MATAAQVFALTGGEMSFAARFALAAYHLGGSEIEGDEINLRNAAADSTFTALGANVTWLTATDLPGLAPAASGNPDFPSNGLSGGVYTRANAAAIIGRASDALFIGFRGTNDTADAGDVLTGTPDNNQWSAPENYYAALAPLIAGLDAYAANAANGIASVYVFGHSLGGAAAQEFMGDHAGSRYQAITFASIGTNLPGDADVPDARQTNVMIENDIAWWRFDGSHENRGDNNLVSIGLSVLWASDIHDPRGYAALSAFLDVNGVGRSTINGARDYDSVLLEVTTYDTTAGNFVFGQGADDLEGTSANEILVGGANADSLDGGSGMDFLTGGSGADTLIGGAGQDILWGGSGRDVLVGGADRDIFDYNAIAETGKTSSTRDIVMDFHRGSSTTGDDIDLRTIDAKSGVSGNNAFKFIGSADFHRSKGELHIKDKGAHILVEGDVNGDGRADFSILVLNVAKLGSGDFIL